MNTISKLITDIPENEKENVEIATETHHLWTSSWGTSFQIENFFSDKDLEWLTDLMYRNHHSRRVKECGTLHFFVDNKQIEARFFDQLKEVIPEIENTNAWEGNFVLTSTPYNLHIDTGRSHLNQKGLVPGKQIIIPLFVCHTNSLYKNSQEIPEAGTGIFKNRFIQYGSNFAKSHQTYSTDVFYTVRDYEKLRCFHEDGLTWNVDWNKPFDDGLYNKYFTHFPKEWLDGFELDNVYNWKRKSLIVFDRCQAHCGINFIANKVTLKAGLSLMTNKRIS